MPITWRNVPINTGSSAAAFGNAAANYGRTALQGISLFNDAMSDRVTREDALRTNEAIGVAQRGGPQTSTDRRVDANALQLSVERARQGERLEDQNTLSLETGRLENIGQGFTNQQDEFKVSEQEESLRLKRLLDQANLENKQQNTAESRIRVNDLNRQVEDAARIRKSVKDQNDYLYGGGRDADIRSDWEALDHGDDDALTQEADFAQYRETVISQSLSDPDYGPRMAHKVGLSIKEWIAETDEGSQWGEARSINFAADAEEARERAKDKVVFNDGLSATIAGNKQTILHDPGSPDGITFGKAAGKITSDDQKVVLTDLNIDADEDDSKDFMRKLNSEFKNPGMYKYVAETIIGDSKEIPNNYEHLIDGWAFTVSERAKQLQNPTVFRSGGTPAQQYAARREARDSGKKETKTADEIAQEEVDVFDPQALKAAITPDKGKANEIRDNAVSSLRDQLSKLSGIKSDLTVGQGFAYRKLRRAIKRIEDLKGTEKDGGLNNWQLNYIRESEVEATQLLNTIEGERRTALDRAINR